MFSLRGEERAIIPPISGLNKNEKKKAPQYPIFLLAPIAPTIKQSTNHKINISTVIDLRFLSCVY